MIDKPENAEPAPEPELPQDATVDDDPDHQIVREEYASGRVIQIIGYRPRNQST